jgi:hypothetical protein
MPKGYFEGIDKAVSKLLRILLLPVVFVLSLFNIVE